MDNEQDLPLVVFMNLGRLRQPIPKLPETLEECEALLKKHFELVKNEGMETTQGGGYGTGGESASKLVIRCPFCGFEFDAIERAGCFHAELTPSDCPNCQFPHSIINQTYKITR